MKERRFSQAVLNTIMFGILVYINLRDNMDWMLYITVPCFVGCLMKLGCEFGKEKLK